MYKLILTYLLSLQVLFSNAQQPVGTNLYRLKSGNLVLTVDANTGARIISLTMDHDECLTGNDIHPENYGSTLWTSPQSDWGWPPAPVLDKLPYTVETLKDGFKFTSGITSSVFYQCTKQITSDSQDTSFSIVYTIKNISNHSQKVAAWEVTRVPGEGITFFAGDTSTLRRDSNMNFQNIAGINWYIFSPAPSARKAYLNGDGWLACVNRSGLFIKVFQDIPAGTAAPQEDEVEVYVNPGKTYIELENQSRYTLLEPGQSLVWSVKWFLRKGTGQNPEPSAYLKNRVLFILNKAKNE